MFLVGDCVFALHSEVSVHLSFKDLIEDFVALLQDLFLACQHPVHLEVPHDFLLALDEWVKRFRISQAAERSLDSIAKAGPQPLIILSVLQFLGKPVHLLVQRFRRHLSATRPMASLLVLNLELLHGFKLSVEPATL